MANNSSKAASAQGMATNVTYVQSQNPDTVLNNVRTCADVANKAGVRLVVACSQFMIVRAYQMNDQERWGVERSRDYLKTQLGYQGLKTAMSYRYIQTALELARGIIARHGLGGVMLEFFTAKDENKAYGILLDCTIAHGYLKPGVTGPTKPWEIDAEHKPRLSMDVLRINLGLDKIVAPVIPALGGGLEASTTVPGQAPTAEQVVATKAAPKTIIARLKADKELVKSLPESVIMAGADVIGREKMAERLVSLMTLDECVKLQTAIVARLQVLAEPAPAKVDTVAAVDVAEHAGTTLPVPSPVDGPAEQTEQPATRKSRPRSRKVA